MAWLPQKQLDAAVDAMIACSAVLTTHNTKRLRIMHPTQMYDRRKWEAIICANLSAAGTQPDAVLPDGVILHYMEKVA